jgi:hypothetical protein
MLCISRQQFFDRPNMVSQASRHRGREFNGLGRCHRLDFQVGMRAAKIGSWCIRLLLNAGNGLFLRAFGAHQPSKIQDSNS